MSDCPNRLLVKEIRARCQGQLRVDEPLKKHTTFGMGGPADLFFFPADLEDLTRVIPLVKDSGLSVLPVGGGTNLLVRESGFRGIVISLSNGATKIAMEIGRGRVQAGASLQVFSRRCCRTGRTGMEFGCGIPGTVGGAIWGNAGAWGEETLERLEWLRGVNMRTGETVEILKKKIDFGYRYTDLPEGLLVVEASFHLEEDDPKAVHRRMEEILAKRKATQPLWKRNAGCIFKNPTDFTAGFLIDKAGCKGFSIGQVEVSNVHANFFVNHGGGVAREVLALIGQVRKRVEEETGIKLEIEPRILGEQGIEDF